MEDQIKALEQEIEAKKTLLKVLKTEQKEKSKKPFIQSKFAQGYFKTVSFLTKPLAKMNQQAQKIVSDPEGYHGMQLYSHAAKLLEESSKIQGTDRKMANKLAKTLMDLEDHAVKRDLKIRMEILDDLERELERVRPPKDTEQFNKIKQMVENALPTVVE